MARNWVDWVHGSLVLRLVSCRQPSTERGVVKGVVGEHRKARQEGAPVCVQVDFVKILNLIHVHVQRVEELVNETAVLMVRGKISHRH